VELLYRDLEYGITCIETYYRRPGLASCYLIEHQGEAALVDTGTAHTAPLIMELLDKKGLSRNQVKYVIPTHVHLDHAGGAGQLMELLPSAQLVIHPLGSRHMIDPAKLAASATAVYGEAQFKEDYDELKPIDAARVIEAQDGFEISLGERRLVCIDTPGHARHHMCIWDQLSRGFFTGDTFGISYRELDTDNGPFVMLTTTPVQFDPAAWHSTLDKLMSHNPERIYLTHYCAIENPEPLSRDLKQQIDVFVDIALKADPDNRYREIKSALMDYFLQQLDDHGCRLDRETLDKILDMDLGLCAQGLEVWLQRRDTTPAS
jgi:glyoxylase-like metal-dependent hydrolase (beta-lactamase superfamily II)